MGVFLLEFILDTAAQVVVRAGGFERGFKMGVTAFRIIKEIDIQHAEAVADMGIVLDGQRFFQQQRGVLVLIQIVLDEAEQIKRLIVEHIQRESPLGKGFGGLPVFDGDEMLHKMQHGFNIVGILAELLHQRANLAVHTGVRLRCFHAGRAGRHDKLGIKKALRQGDDQHGRKADPQKDQQQARGQRGDGSGRGISHGSAAPVVQDAPQGGAAPRP